MNLQRQNKPLPVPGKKARPKLADRIHRTLLTAVIAVALLGMLMLAVTWILNAPAPDFGGGDEVVTIEQGMSLGQITQVLQEKRLINHPTAFKLAARLMGVDRKLQPGSFLIERGANNTRVLRLLLIPMIRTKNVTIPEGLTARDIAVIFKDELGVDTAEFNALCEDSLFALGLGVPSHRLEGYLFPDTYNFYLDTPAAGIIERMVGHFFEVVNDTFEIRMRLAGMTLHQVVTLASIIEGEVQIPNEAPLVSAVYHNRLKKRMALEADPTIQYIIPDGPRRLRRSDLLRDSPYNTYRRSGLPPGPINNPGIRSLRSAIEPAKVDYLYFVAQGDGSHAFNTTYSGHLSSKQKLDQLRRELDREKAEG